ncbi:MAG: hypothetical protein BGN87_00295 [Rhizobiales bacterium 65-79]|nr:hypothetical protein [Hyphomicrobiales bacterium]OJU02623.1 MAG: hypothetical protein BGN87_00295 [Rhizobiales bacterium 65-79]
MSGVTHRLTFSDAGDFAAERRAVAFLEERGFSVGRMQHREPRGILLGNFDIQKWHNLSAADRAGLHGVMTGDMRNGPVVVEMFDSAPDIAKSALAGCPATIVERQFASDELATIPLSLDPAKVQLLEPASVPAAGWMDISCPDLGSPSHTRSAEDTPCRPRSPSQNPSEDTL